MNTLIFCHCGNEMNIGVNCSAVRTDAEDQPISIHCGDIYTCPVCGNQIILANETGYAFADQPRFYSLTKTILTEQAQLLLPFSKPSNSM
jgi:hypothetical protein